MATNDYKWPKLNRIPEALVRDCDRLMDTQCTSIEIKYDGANFSVDESGGVHSRNQTLPLHSKTYNGSNDLAPIYAIPVDEIKKAFEKICSVQLVHLRVVGEFMVNPKSEWDRDKLGRYIVFGMLVQGHPGDDSDTLVKNMTDQGFGVYIDWTNVKYNKFTIFKNSVLKEFLKPYNVDICQSYISEPLTLHQLIQKFPEDFFKTYEGLVITLKERGRLKNEIEKDEDAGDSSIGALKWTRSNITGDVNTLQTLASSNKDKPWHGSIQKLIRLLGDERTTKGALQSAATKTNKKTEVKFEAIRDVAEELEKLLTKKGQKVLLSQIVDITNQP